MYVNFFLGLLKNYLWRALYVPGPKSCYCKLPKLAFCWWALCRWTLSRLYRPGKGGENTQFRGTRGLLIHTAPLSAQVKFPMLEGQVLFLRQGQIALEIWCGSSTVNRRVPRQQPAGGVPPLGGTCAGHSEIARFRECWGVLGAGRRPSLTRVPRLLSLIYSELSLHWVDKKNSRVLCIIAKYILFLFLV